ncbi:MAG: hypothetical protein HKN43_13025 [Rhodothermales bacterium]|nr:hypothetical protein [Rhodothermales bacterium]
MTLLNLKSYLIALTVLVCTALTSVGYGQGFSGFNGRNHPELDWLAAETQHFVVVYPDHLAGIEFEVGSIAEESYRVLEQNLGVSFDRKIRVYVSDEDEIANGFAMDVGNGHTNIWVHVNDIAETWTGREKWLRKVIAHELAHIFHYRTVRSRWRPFDRLAGNALPRFWTEGLAQYQTERWDTFRGERWLRTAVLDDRLSYNDGRSIWNGHLLYAVGNSQVRYFAEQYGDSTLSTMLTVRRPIFFGLAKVHDFEHAFKVATGDSYSEFRDDWRRHINIQYNTLASTMENVDSLGQELVHLPGQYVYDIRYDKGSDEFIASLLESIERPVNRLVATNRLNSHSRILEEGSIGPQVSVAGDRTAFSMRNRGSAGSIVNDVFVTRHNSVEPEKLTTDRRASFPDLSSDQSMVAFVATDAGTANIVVRNLESESERRLTTFQGDHQIGRLRWSPDDRSIAFSSFDTVGDRTIEIVDVENGEHLRLTDGRFDDRGPVWSPDGRRVAFTSLRDGVPNVFIANVRTGTIRRVTNVVTGTAVHDWIVTTKPDSTTVERLVVVSARSKSSDVVNLVDPSRTPHVTHREQSAELWRWTERRPPNVVPEQIPIDQDVIVDRLRYNSLSNLTHTFSLASPYYNSGTDWGLFGMTAWMEPLGKHLIFATGGLSIPSFSASSFLSLSYVNRQFRPTVQTSLYHLPTSVRPYGNTVIEERATGTTLSAFLPIDRFAKPYSSSTAFARFRFMSVEPVNPESIPVFENLLPPESGSQVDLRLGVVTRKLLPYRHNLVHPLDGHGVRLRGTIGVRNSDIDKPFVIGDIAAYKILRAPGMSRFMLYGRIQAQEGTALAQNYMGLSRYDELRISSPNLFEITFSDVERVRGYRSFVVGNRLAFATAEYRVPVAPSLQTRILGVLSFGKTTASLFADGAIVFTDQDFAGRDARLGAGIELKNALTIGNAITFMHALGAAWPQDDFSVGKYEIYYRIRTSLPF